MQQLVAFLSRIHKGVVFCEKALVLLLLFTMIFLAVGQVVARNVFSAGFIWVDEVLRIQVLWLAFLGAGLAAEYNRHVKIDVLSHVLGSTTATKTVDTAAQVFAMVVCVFLFIAAVIFIQVEARYSSSVLIRGVPDWVFRVIIPYFFFSMSIRCLINMRRIYLGTHTRSIEP
ncbi:MAG: TRAP transporter small permease [Deltaproteobacteria bacterium]|nr:TRAP transporter small permease [Deltaproteobacteria bacterium]